MKKFTTLIVMCFIVLSTMAQERIAFPLAPMESKINRGRGLDTLLPNSVINGATQEVLATSQEGFICGTNEFNDLAKAQRYSMSVPGRVKGCIVWVAVKEGNTGNLILNVYDAKGSGYNYSGNAVGYAPGSVLGTVSKPLSEIKGGYTLEEGLNFFEFPTPIEVGASFYVGFDFSQLGTFPNNKVGVASSKNGSGLGADMAWEKWDDGTWVSMYYTWTPPFDSDMMFLPIVEFDDVECGVNELPFFEDFETSSLMCWSLFDVDGGGGNWFWNDELNNTQEGSSSMGHVYGEENYEEDNLLISPMIKLPAGKKVELSFWSYVIDADYYGKNSVLISTDGDNFEQVWTAESVKDTIWEKITIDLSNYAGDTIEIGFRYQGEYAHIWVVDDVKVEAVGDECEDTVCPENIIVCEGVSLIELSGAKPEGGVYSGDFVENNVFDVELAGVGLMK